MSWHFWDDRMDCGIALDTIPFDDRLESCSVEINKTCVTMASFEC
jgi:hypothetical protein